VDVNGTRFHLIKAKDDWGVCRVELASGATVPLAGNSRIKPLRYDDQSESLTLSSRLLLFTSARRHVALDVAERRGAAPDSFGNWYWIGADRRTIFWMPLGAARPLVYWSQGTPARCDGSEQFEPLVEERPLIAELAGLAVTEHHYLVVGNVPQHGLFLFDLHSGGEPMLLLFPERISFEPFDLAAAPGGGVWILDRKHKAYWGLDKRFRVVTDDAHLQSIAPEEDFGFHPIGELQRIRPRREFPVGFSVAARDPVSIEALPDGTVLILDRLADLPPRVSREPVSLVLRYRFGRLEAPALLLSDEVEVVTEDEGKARRVLNVVAYDIAFAGGRLYAVESEGSQALSFQLDPEHWPAQLRISTDFLPLHYFGRRALVAWEDGIFYDVVGGDSTRDELVRWLQLQAIDEAQYDREGALVTPVLDGKERDCVWHRLLIEACIPAESFVEVWTRAQNDPDLLPGVPFRREPDPYLRGAGPELPFYDAFPDRDALPEFTGTWELLFQQARGRYLEIKLVVGGNERTTPHLHALRAYYPRFSYPKHYMPKVYQDDEESASFLERMLANTEGFYSDIEGRINDVSLLFDARSAPAEALDWLAGWVGLALDPLWARIQQQRQATTGSAGTRVADRRRLFIRLARKLYDRRGTPSGILFAVHLLLDPCLEVTLQRLKTIAVRPNALRPLQDQLEKFSLPSPNPGWREEEFEDLLYEYVLAPERPSKVRLVERYRTRGGRAKVAGDPTQQGTIGQAAGAPDAFAHSFSVLVPEGLTPEEEAMVERIVNLEKPAHTAFDVRRYWDYFRVGEARLGIDTQLGEESRFQKIVVGRSYLAEGYLHPPHPMDSGDRVVSDRDRAGQLPPL